MLPSIITVWADVHNANDCIQMSYLRVSVNCTIEPKNFYLNSATLVRCNLFALGGRGNLILCLCV